MRLTSRSQILIRYMSHWVGFNEYGGYTGTEPYISNKETREKIVRGAMDKAKKLSGLVRYE